MTTLRTTITKRTLLSGANKMYPNIVSYKRITNEDLINYMVSNSGINRPVAIAAVSGLRRAITNFLLNGHSVNIPQFGTLSVSAKTKAVDSNAKADASCIQSLRVRFTPEGNTKQACRSVKFTTLMDDDVKMQAPEADKKAESNPNT